MHILQFTKIILVTLIYVYFLHYMSNTLEKLCTDKYLIITLFKHCVHLKYRCVVKCFISSPLGIEFSNKFPVSFVEFKKGNN